MPDTLQDITLNDKITLYGNLISQQSISKGILDQLVKEHNIIKSDYLIKSEYYGKLQDSNSQFIFNKIRDKYVSTFRDYVSSVAELKKSIESNQLQLDELTKDTTVVNGFIYKSYSIVKAGYKNGIVDCDTFEKAIRNVSKKEVVEFADSIVTNSKGQVLLLKRRHSSKFPSVWCLPGGHVDPGEDFKDAAIRECEEETGLVVIDCKEIHEYKEEGIHIKYYQCVVENKLEGTCDPQVMLDSNEHDNYQFFDKEEWQDVDMIPNLKDILNFLFIDDIEKTAIETIKKGIQAGVVTGDVLEQLLDIEKAKSHKYIRKEGDGKGGSKYIYKESSDKVSKEDSTEVNLKKIKEYANKVIKGEEQIERLSPEEEQGRNRGGVRNVEAAILVGTITGTNTEDPEGQREEQEERLTNWANKEGIFYNYEENRSKLDFVGAGEEAKVYKLDEENVIKFVDPSVLNVNPLEYLDRISLHNLLFPETPYKLLGVSERENKDGDIVFNFVVSQTTLKNVENSDKEELLKLMEEMGFEQIDSKTFCNNDYIISDCHSANVLQDSNGNLLFVDPNITLNLENEGYGGNRKYGAIELPKEDTEDYQTKKKRLLTEVEDLVKVKKQKYPEQDISKPYREGEKELEAEIAKKYGVINQLIKDNKNIKKAEDALNIIRIAFEQGKVDQGILEKAVSKYGASQHQEKVKVNRGGKIFERTQTVGGGKEGQQSNDSKYDPEDLKKYAKEASEKDLQRSIKEHGDENMRKIAHQELERRKNEEHVNNNDSDKFTSYVKESDDKKLKTIIENSKNKDLVQAASKELDNRGNKNNKTEGNKEIQNKKPTKKKEYHTFTGNVEETVLHHKEDVINAGEEIEKFISGKSNTLSDKTVDVLAILGAVTTPKQMIELMKDKDFQGKILKDIKTSTEDLKEESVNKINIDDIDVDIPEEGGIVKVKHKGKEVEFDDLRLVVDGKEAFIPKVKKKEGGEKGIGTSAYIKIGEELKNKGVKLVSSDALYADGMKLWQRLVKMGYAKKNGNSFEFVGKDDIKKSEDINQLNKIQKWL